MDSLPDRVIVKNTETEAFEKVPFLKKFINFRNSEQNYLYGKRLGRWVWAMTIKDLVLIIMAWWEVTLDPTWTPQPTERLFVVFFLLIITLSVLYGDMKLNYCMKNVHYRSFRQGILARGVPYGIMVLLGVTCLLLVVPALLDLRFFNNRLFDCCSESMIYWFLVAGMFLVFTIINAIVDTYPLLKCRKKFQEIQVEHRRSMRAFRLSCSSQHSVYL